VPINTAYKGALLEHVLKNAGSEIIIAHANLAELLKDVKTANLKTVVVIGNERPMIDGLDVQGASLVKLSQLTFSNSSEKGNF
jgi:crotonobetaine/carnitine-CoA ligase